LEKISVLGEGRKNNWNDNVMHIKHTRVVELAGELKGKNLQRRGRANEGGNKPSK